MIDNTDNYLTRLIKAYEEEGYCVSVGLSTNREGPNSSFAYFIKKDDIISNYNNYIYLKKEIHLIKKIII